MGLETPTHTTKVTEGRYKDRGVYGGGNKIIVL
jgi:hypothetical protein